MDWYDDWKKQGQHYRVNNPKLFKKLKAEKKKLKDELFHEAHEEAFQQIDCLDCANCCKTTSPIFSESDISRLARVLKMSEGDFKVSYLRQDEENDYVLQSSPCPFLGHDNKCIVYEQRPKACREYPHTNRKRMYQIIPLTFKNAEVCPAVFRVLESIKDEMEI